METTRDTPIATRSFVRETNFLTEGRAIVNSVEASAFVGSQVGRTLDDRPFMIFVRMEDLARIQVIRMLRKLAIWVKPEPDYYSSNLSKTRATFELRRLLSLHGFDKTTVDGVNDGAIFLTDKFSWEFNRVVSNQSSKKEGLEKVLELIRENTHPVFVDDVIVRAYFTNRNVSQKSESTIQDESDEDEITEITNVEEGLSSLGQQPETLQKVAEKLIEAPTAEDRTMLLESLSNAINDLDLTVTNTTALVRGAEGEAQMRILSLEGRISEMKEQMTRMDTEAAVLTEDMDKTEHRHEKEIKRLQSANAKTIETLTLEKELLSQQVEKLLAKKTETPRPTPVLESESDTDEYEEDIVIPRHAKGSGSRRTVPLIASVEPEEKPEKPADKFLATPSKFGMKTWDEEDCSFLEHLSRLEMGLAQAELKGCSVKTQQNLILMTLPTGYDWAADFMEEEDRETMAKFKAKLTELICGTDADQTSALLSAHRKENENILSYFRRLKSLYAYCTNQESGETTTYGLYTFYNKLAEAMPQIARIEFTRLCEDAMANKKFTFDALKKFTVQAARKAPKTTSPMLAEISNKEQSPRQHMSPSGSSVPTSGPTTKTTGQRETRRCYVCRKIGHIAKNCYLRKSQAKQAEREANDRESKDEKGRVH